MEKFLVFWNTHNTSIIEGLIAIILILAVIVAYRLLFSKSDDEEIKTVNINTEAIEKSLEKILENQKKNVPAPEDLGINVQLDESTMSGDISKAPPKLVEAIQKQVEQQSVAQVEQLKVELQKKEKEVQSMKVELESKPKAAAPVDAAPSAELTGKIKDLEARLSEYEIISEEIADLTKYKEENKKLREEIVSIKKGGGSEQVVAGAASPKSGEVIDQTSAPKPDSGAVIDATAKTSDAPATESTKTESSDAVGGIDDDLMKEFAAAVENQKIGGIGSGGDTPERVEEKSGDTKDLINEFENFVKKS